MTGSTILLAAICAAATEGSVSESIQGPAITAQTVYGTKRFAFKSWPFDFLCEARPAAPHSVVVSMEQPPPSDGRENEGPALLRGKNDAVAARVWLQEYGPKGAQRDQPPDPADDGNWRGAGGRDPYWLVILPTSWISNPKVEGGTFRGRRLSQADGQWRTFDVLPHFAVDLSQTSGPDEFAGTLVFEVRASNGDAVPFRFRGEGEHERQADGFSHPCMALKCPIRLTVSAPRGAPAAKATSTETEPKPSLPATKPNATQPAIKITSPSDGHVTGSRVITVSGTSQGLPAGSAVQIYVTTDADYLQDLPAKTKADGTWSSNAILGGTPLPYEHRIFAVATAGGATVRSQTIRVTKQAQDVPCAAPVEVGGNAATADRDRLARAVERGIAFLDDQRITDDGTVDGRRFRGLYRSFKADPRNPDSESLAKHGRAWIYDQALAIYAELKFGHTAHAKEAVETLIALAESEKSKGFRGLWHFSYNTLGDNFVDPRGPLGANLWGLSAILAYMNQTGDTARLQWVNDVLLSFIFTQQVTEPTDPRFGLFRAGLENSADLARGDTMGYHVYEGTPAEVNSQVEFCGIEHLADAIVTLRLADRVNRRLGSAPGLVREIARRHQMALAALDRLWVREPEGHFVTGMNGDGTLNRSVAVDNNTWPASVLLPCDEERAWQCLQYTNHRFRTTDQGFDGLFFFQKDFADRYVQIPAGDRGQLPSVLHPEATWGFVHCLKQFAAASRSPPRKADAQALMDGFVANMLALQEERGGTPYASRAIRNYFTTLEGIAGTATATIVCLELLGKPDDDFIGARPSPELIKLAPTTHDPTKKEIP